MPFNKKKPKKQNELCCQLGTSISLFLMCISSQYYNHVAARSMHAENIWFCYNQAVLVLQLITLIFLRLSLTFIKEKGIIIISILLFTRFYNKNVFQNEMILPILEDVFIVQSGKQ